MSEDQGQQTDAAPAGVAEDTAPRWGTLPAAARQQELDARLHAWAQLSAEEQAQRKGPFAEVALTGADVFHLAAWALAGRAVLAWDQRPFRYYREGGRPAIMWRSPDVVSQRLVTQGGRCHFPMKWSSVNHKLPSGPVTIPLGKEFRWSMGHSSITCPLNGLI